MAFIKLKLIPQKIIFQNTLKVLKFKIFSFDCIKFFNFLDIPKQNVKETVFGFKRLEMTYDLSVFKQNNGVK